jgi:hypothetical protein
MKRIFVLLPFLTLPVFAHNAPQIVDTGTAELYVCGGLNDGWHYLKRDDLSTPTAALVAVCGLHYAPIECSHVHVANSLRDRHFVM